MSPLNIGNDLEKLREQVAEEDTCYDAYGYPNGKVAFKDAHEICSCSDYLASAGKSAVSIFLAWKGFYLNLTLTPLAYQLGGPSILRSG